MLTGTKSWLRQSVLIASPTGLSGEGRETYGAGVATPCRIEYDPKMVQGADNQMVVSSSAIYVDGAVSVTVLDRVTLPDGSTPSILTVETVPGPDGAAYLKVVRT